MKITQIELLHLDVPFTAHTNQHMQYWLPHWRISQLCKITLENGVVGWGETIPNYIMSIPPMPSRSAKRVRRWIRWRMMAVENLLSCTKPCKMGVQCAEWNSENFMGAHLDAIL